MNIGIFGGTFDPVHIGHLILAETVRDQFSLDEIWFIPAHIPPHKQELTISHPKDRIAMLEFAIAGHANFKINPLEIKRDGPSYTVDTLRELQSSHPADQFHLLIGADSLTDFPTWKSPHEIMTLAKIIAVNRGHDPADMESVRHALGEQADERIQIIEMPLIGISSTELRYRCKTGLSIRFQTPRAVELYIQQHLLYR